ncbi:hypothetical protein SRHO_G00009930 [Serrasalmus rhombeus]
MVFFSPFTMASAQECVLQALSFMYQETAFSHQPHMVPENTSNTEGLADAHHHPSQFSPPVTVWLPSVHHLRPHLRLVPRRPPYRLRPHHLP